jgi:hypothetical protein
MLWCYFLPGEDSNLRIRGHPGQDSGWEAIAFMQRNRFLAAVLTSAT